MSKITIKDEKTPTRCEICHQDDVFIPHLNSCYRCDDIDADKLDDIDGSDGSGRVNQQHQQQYQHYQPQYQQPNQYRVISSPSSSKRTKNYPSKTPLQKVVTSLKLTKMGELPSLPNANTNTYANQAFASTVSQAKDNTYRPQYVYVSYPKQRGIFFQIGVFTGVIMAVMFLFSLFLTK